MIAWYWLIVALAVGGLITSAIEYKLKYNLTDEEIDLLKSLYGKASNAEQSLIARLLKLLGKVEFWKK